MVLPTALAGVYRYSQAGNVEWGLVLPLALGGVLGALLGAAAVTALGAGALKPGAWRYTPPETLGDCPLAIDGTNTITSATTISARR